MSRREKETKQKPVKQWPSPHDEIDLAIKYRPQFLNDLYGNSLLKKSLNSAINNEEIPHAILLYGEFGCGKTSIARILAKEVNCNFDFDLKEIDIADFTGVDLIRDIRKRMNQKPMKGKSKVYLFDEIHRLSSNGMDALLKALEEPPKHCYFILCTTDPQKLINTIKSRCVQYSVQPLSDKQIYKLLQDIAEKEEIKLEKKVGLQIARDSLGHPRNALKILNRIRFLDPENMLEAAKDEAEKQEQIITLCRAIINKKDWKEVASILKNLKEEPEMIRRSIRGYFASVLLNNGNIGAFNVLDTFSESYHNTDGKNQLIRDVYETLHE